MCSALVVFTNYNDDITTIRELPPCALLFQLNCIELLLFPSRLLISHTKVQMAEIGASEEAWIDNMLCDSSISNNHKMD